LTNDEAEHDLRTFRGRHGDAYLSLVLESKGHVAGCRGRAPRARRAGETERGNERRSGAGSRGGRRRARTPRRSGAVEWGAPRGRPGPGGSRRATSATSALRNPGRPRRRRDERGPRLVNTDDLSGQRRRDRRRRRRRRALRRSRGLRDLWNTERDRASKERPRVGTFAGGDAATAGLASRRARPPRAPAGEDGDRRVERQQIDAALRTRS
jgi:hypothetical protein